MSEKSKPLVSIIVPVFNSEKYLGESLDSILAQTYQRTEILVMDDASTDSTPEIIGTYGDRIIHIRQPQNKGQFPNVNDGIEKAKGKYIAIYHADDVYSSKIVEREVEFLEQNENIGAVFCRDIFINQSGREYGRLTVPAELQTESYLDYQAMINAQLTYKNTFLPTPGAMVRASVYEELGKFRGEEFRIAADLEMWLRIARRFPIALVPDYLFSYRHGHGNSSQIYYQARTEEEIYFRILDSHLDDGAREFAAAKALRDFEAHRAEDFLMIAINSYISGKAKESAAHLGKVKVRRILGSPQIQRGRLSILFLLMRILLGFPRIPFVANLFNRRWNLKTYPA